MRRLIALLLAPLAIAVARAETPDDFVERTTTAHIQPAYTQLAGTTATLQSAAKAFCARPSGATLDATRQAFAPAFIAWQGAQHIRFGAVQLFMREYRFDLWPDKHGTVGKHLVRLTADVGKDPSVLEPDAFANGTVAVQGFSAMERLLYGEGIDRYDAPGFDARCKVLSTIGENLATMSADIVRNWATPSPPEDAAERDGELLGSINTELERVVAQKLALPLGSELKYARGTRAEGWRSGLSLAAIRENLNATRALYRVGYKARAKAVGLDGKLEKAWAAALDALEAIGKPLDEAVADPVERPKVETLRARVSELKTMVGSDLAPALDLTLGFNNLDGD
ncbi:imelysin family protein [Nitrogeniibacter aestuarii]|uniref:imelysin family protein n=1 Tax=Nitrogeniibacter aestuarii TaxID=2815343 RepID=UPI001E431022|nr:imelysin family protein [Nitrogeniibacter aestuarii]